jgi:trehalose 6-phosphate phosphatase
MIYLLSEEGRRAMSAMATRPILYAFDFDGTLAPISPDRNAVKMPYSVSEWLKELARRAPCAVVSGRGLADLAPRVGGMVPYVIGNHGIERPTATREDVRAAEGICLEWKETIATSLAKPLEDLGVEVEDKRFSLTFHFRGATEVSKVHLAILGLLQQLTPAPRVVPGKASVNLLPPGTGGKGPAVLELMLKLRQSGLFFVGDDETDENVFALKEGLVMGVRVGRYAESRAQFYLKQQGELEEVLRFLVHRIDRTPELLDRGGLGTAGAKPAVNDR